MDSQLIGVGIKGYRSFAGDMQFVGPLTKVNLLSGQNNAGKSNVIRLVAHHLSDYRSWGPANLDVPRGPDADSSYALALCLPTLDELRRHIPAVRNLNQRLTGFLDRVLTGRAMQLNPHAPGAWIRFHRANSAGSLVLDPDQLADLTKEFGMQLRELSGSLTSTSGGNPGEDARRVLELLSEAIHFPKVHLLDAFRRIRTLSTGTEMLDDTDLINRIAKMQNPDALTQEHDEKAYRALNELISEVFEEPGAQIVVPHSPNTINIRTRNDILLPLENHGTGLHQVIMIAAIAATISHSLICIEEPEVNLHPILQRRLLRFLAEKTDNQYLITTHSAQMLDFERATIFHLTNGPEGTQISRAVTPAEIASICIDLGYRPSDLLQANAIIWVEGPADRIYINHWLTSLNAGLVEGIHYAILQYGGSLLNSYSADDTRVTEFINLRDINRFVAVVIDSDKKTSKDPLNDTKQRIIREIDTSRGPGMTWVTSGYTIENYVPFELLQEAVKIVHPHKEPTIKRGRWRSPLSFKDPDKPKIAKMVVARWPDPLSDPEIHNEVKRLHALILRANEATHPELGAASTEQG